MRNLPIPHALGKCASRISSVATVRFPGSPRLISLMEPSMVDLTPSPFARRCRVPLAMQEWFFCGPLRNQIPLRLIFPDQARQR